MDARKFGGFIQMLRKELGLTQAQLGERLGVTDKAISRWERGVGFPDISLLEPLAEALGVTVVELMRSEKIEAETITKEDAGQAMAETIGLAALQQRMKFRKRLMRFGLIPLVYLVEMFLTGVVAWYVTEPFWFRVVCIAVVTYSGLFACIGIWRLSKYNPLEPPKPGKPAMFYITTVLSCLGVAMLGVSWLMSPYDLPVFQWVALVGMVLAFSWAYYCYWLITDEIKVWNRFAGGRDIPKWVPWWKRKKK